jgi:hypothetical protein
MPFEEAAAPTLGPLACRRRGRRIDPNGVVPRSPSSPPDVSNLTALNRSEQTWNKIGEPRRWHPILQCSDIGEASSGSPLHHRSSADPIGELGRSRRARSATRGGSPRPNGSMATSRSAHHAGNGATSNPTGATNVKSAAVAIHRHAPVLALGPPVAHRGTTRTRTHRSVASSDMASSSATRVAHLQALRTATPNAVDAPATSSTERHLVARSRRGIECWELSEARLHAGPRRVVIGT